MSLATLTASFFVLQIKTPLPEANPSTLITNGSEFLSINNFALLKSLKALKFAVGILYLFRNFFENSLEVSNFAAFFEGPKTFIFFFVK